MENWLHPLELKGKFVTLTPLRADHRQALLEAATDGELSALWYTEVPSEETVDGYIEAALAEQQLGRALPFVVVENESGAIIGSTRFMNAASADRRLEIGHTWYAKRVQGTKINPECKLLMLSHAFEVLNAIAVEFRTHWHNHASRRAIAKLGAKQDGVLRNHRIGKDGIYRDTVVFSIIEGEWPAVKQGLCSRLN